jgi:hypothetical protein
MIASVAAKLERAVIDALRPGEGGERFDLPATARPRLARALRSDLAGTSSAAALRTALELAAALDHELDSPSAAARVREVLRSDPDAVALLRAEWLGARPIDEQRLFAKREGRRLSVAAPTMGEGAPPRSIPLRALLDPSGPLRGQRGPSVSQRERGWRTSVPRTR